MFLVMFFLKYTNNDVSTRHMFKIVFDFIFFNFQPQRDIVLSVSVSAIAFPMQ